LIDGRTQRAIDHAKSLISDYWYAVHHAVLARRAIESGSQGRAGNRMWKQIVNQESGYEAYKIPSEEELASIKANKLKEVDDRVEAITAKHGSIKKLKIKADRAYKRWYRPLKKETTHGTL